MTRRRSVFVAAVASLVGCGVTSIAPLVTDADLADEPGLVGTWQDAGAKESAVITAAGAGNYHVVYADEDGKTGRFDARLGRLGTFRVLDLQPVDPLPAASDTYKSLLVRAHGIVIVDSVGRALVFRLVKTDSLIAYLKQRPEAVAHTIVDDAVLLTAPSVEARRFLMAFVSRIGVLGEPNVWRRRAQ